MKTLITIITVITLTGCTITMTQGGLQFKAKERRDSRRE